MPLWRWIGRAAYWLAMPALFVYLRIGARTRVLVLAEGRVLLVQGWMSDGRWSLPGGGLHRGEQSLAGAIRETAEESGVVLQPGQCKLLGSEQFSEGWRTFHCHFFAANLASKVPVREQRGEIIGVQWVSLADLATLPHKAEIDRALQLAATQG